ncbi:MAG: AAA family ATPase [Actinobacteria bacterium]|jgi:DNA polymerase III delta prime subunit|nr:AAA family ATPase [Actinomycetota bacterium]
MNEVLWVEKYRPHKISDCILPDEYKSTFQSYVDRKEIPHLLLCGGPGTGKTTVARALCDEIGCDYLMINGSDESGIDTFRVKIKNYASSMSLDGGKKVIIIDEADYLNPNSTQPAMRAAMEEFAHNCTFIMTCNYKNRIIEPLHSRCAVIEFKLRKEDKPKMAMAFMKRASEILNVEKIPFDKAVLAEVVKKHFPDYRRVLNELQRYSVSGKIDTGILTSIADVSLNDLVTSLKDQNFSAMRKWVADFGSDDPAKIYRKIYDSLYDILDKSTIPNAVLILAKYQYQSAFVADQELNMVACLTEMMVEVKFL